MRLAAVVVLAWAALESSPVAACTRIAEIRMGEPTESATDVPTDVVPWFFGWVSDYPVTITLSRASGESVAVEITRLEGRPFVDYFEIRPFEPLAPHTQYRIGVSGPPLADGPASFSFTTGAGPSSAGSNEELTISGMQVADNHIGSSCEENSIACIGLVESGAVEVTVRDAQGEVEARFLDAGGSVSYTRPLHAQTDPFCVQLRARDVAGRRGPASTICSRDATTFDVSLSYAIGCEGARLRSDGAYVDETTEPRSDGCSAAGQPSETPVWLTVLFLAWRAVRRRRASSR